jgi:uncharacterized membrane protein
VFAALAAAPLLASDGRLILPWTVAAPLLYLANFVITIRVNVPLNDGIKAAGAPDRITDLAGARKQFKSRDGSAGISSALC